MPTDTTTDDAAELLHTLGLIADVAASAAFKAGKPPAQVTAAGLDAALTAGLRLGLIEVRPRAQWPELIPLAGWDTYTTTTEEDTNGI